jgi:hypothetical protein
MLAESISANVPAEYLIVRTLEAWWPSADIRFFLPTVNLGLLFAGLPALALWLIGLSVARYGGLVRPRTWLHPNVSRKGQILFPCTAGAVHTWHF